MCGRHQPRHQPGCTQSFGRRTPSALALIPSPSPPLQRREPDHPAGPASGAGPPAALCQQAAVRGVGHRPSPAAGAAAPAGRTPAAPLPGPPQRGLRQWAARQQRGQGGCAADQRWHSRPSSWGRQSSRRRARCPCWESSSSQQRSVACGRRGEASAHDQHRPRLRALQLAPALGGGGSTQPGSTGSSGGVCGRPRRCCRGRNRAPGIARRRPEAGAGRRPSAHRYHFACGQCLPTFHARPCVGAIVQADQQRGSGRPPLLCSAAAWAGVGSAHAAAAGRVAAPAPAAARRRPCCERRRLGHGGKWQPQQAAAARCWSAAAQQQQRGPACGSKPAKPGHDGGSSRARGGAAQPWAAGQAGSRLCGAS